MSIISNLKDKITQWFVDNNEYMGATVGHVITLIIQLSAVVPDFTAKSERFGLRFALIIWLSIGISEIIMRISYRRKWINALEQNAKLSEELMLRKVMESKLIDVIEKVDERILDKLGVSIENV